MALPPTERAETRVLDEQGRAKSIVRSKVIIKVDHGVDKGKTFDCEKGLIRIGKVTDNDVVLTDDSVSGRHAEIELGERGFLLRDLDSTNGTSVAGYSVREIFLKPNTQFRVGETLLLFKVGGQFEVPLAEARTSGEIVGQSIVMREALAILERFARGDQPVLLSGETGTGKDLFARMLHQQSSRCEGPFEVFECTSANPALIEDELFGHVAGAFSGAVGTRAGVFERAHKGTLLLDEIGDLPMELQPKLLRVLEEKKLRRLGDTKQVTFDVRVCCSSHRDLAAMVGKGEFRADLFYRLNVLKLEIPPLRRRQEDIPLIAKVLLEDRAILDKSALQMLKSYAWPGNVRQLRNVLERAAAFSPKGIISVDDLLPVRRSEQGAPNLGLTTKTYHQAKEECLDVFEKEYVENVLQQFRGNVSHAAEAAAVPRQTLHRLMSKHNIRSGEPDASELD